MVFNAQTNDVTTVILGDEFDDELREKLMRILQELHAIPGESTRSVAGSQDFEEMVVSVNGQILRIESETYVGLSVCGPNKLVKKIKSLVIGD